MEIQFIAENWHLFAALVVICALLAADTLRRSGGSNQVSAVQLPQLINHEGAVVVDVVAVGVALALFHVNDHL